MYSYSFTQWLFVFYFYCFFGWCFESSYVSLRNHKWINRGFIRGPFLPLYGSGACLLLLVSRPFLNYLPLVYLAGCIGATALEYVTGVAMEALFKVRYWDYSNQKFNFQGHICLSSTLTWGFLTILMTKVIHKPVENLLFRIPQGVLSVLVFVLTVLVVSDFSLSFKAAIDLRDVLVKMENAKKDMARIQKRLDFLIALADEELEQRREELQQLRTQYGVLKELRRHFSERQGLIRNMIRNNPTMRSEKYKETFEELRQKLEERRSARKVGGKNEKKAEEESNSEK